MGLPYPLALHPEISVRRSVGARCLIVPPIKFPTLRKGIVALQTKALRSGLSPAWRMEGTAREAGRDVVR